MELNFIHAIYAVLLLLSSLAAVLLWKKWISELYSKERSSASLEHSTGGLRGFYILLWSLLYLTVLAISTPLIFHYSSMLKDISEQHRKPLVVFAAICLPAVLLYVSFLGIKKKYMEWIHDLSWPESEDKS